MLLFIDIYPNQSNNKDFSFNTSHVTLYPTWADIEVALATFQYISCYSLSKCSQRRSCSVVSFNTSHVTLYRAYGTVFIKPNGFQYISCYSLSAVGDLWFNSKTSFQYISCYSLSNVSFL